ncbi:MAG: aminotransferase class V-fold PLP-dependent enzyme [Luteitalea sp.]|nr:aminotransferase class V-fold PLP-dependent enzyme [Luteitalea sp.]
MKLPIYLDYHATTPVDERVLEAMQPYFIEIFGNPASSSHVFGWQASAAVEQARRQVADGLDADPEEIVFTSGASESNNLAIRGVARLCRERGRHIVTVATEHKAVLNTCLALEEDGFRVTVLGVDGEGGVELDAVRAALADDTILVSIMHANNEIGTIQDIAPIGALCRDRGVLFHTDATQSIGRRLFNVRHLNVDLVSFSGHKFYGPKGTGALFIRRSVDCAPLITGGGHESGVRSGTLNVPGVVGLAKAVELANQSLKDETARTREWRDDLWRAIREAVPTVLLNGPDPLERPDDRLPNNLNVSVPGAEGEALVAALDQVAVSTSSACTSASGEGSHVLKAIGRDTEGLTHLRFGLGRPTTREEIDYTIGCIRAVAGARA